jgi:hypothetical protein
VRGWPRNDTDDHGMGFRVVLVLSAAVLVIVIDARSAGWAEFARGGGHGMTRMITEMGIGRARAQRSGARYRNRCARCGDGARRGGPRNTRMTRKGDRGWRDRGDRAWLGILCGRWFWGRMVGRAFVGVCDGGCV